MEAASVVVRCSVLGAVSLPVTELAIVTDRPSRTQAVPRPRTKRVWNGDQSSRSRRDGCVLRIVCGMRKQHVLISCYTSRTSHLSLHTVSTESKAVPQHHQPRLHLLPCCCVFRFP